MSDEMTITVDAEEYVLRPEGGTLRVGRRVGGDTTWLEDVELAGLPEGARDALARGDSADQGLQVALRGVVTGAAKRGG